MARFALILALAGCFTTIGTASGAGIGHIAGNTGRGAKIGAIIGIALDVELIKDLRKLDRLLH